jgi:PQQ-dependent catabolism-associated beta-propeller protein
MIVRAVGLALVLALAHGCGQGDAPVERSEQELRIGVLLSGDERSASVERGIQLGALEAERAGELIGRRFDVRVVEASTARQARRAVDRLSREGVFALIGGFDLETCREIGRAAAERRLVYLNVGCRADVLRESPTPGTFHLEASDWMYAEARAGAEGEPVAEATLWHPDLNRFGAAQLNERFERRFGAPADGPAWAGWMAVKVLWESALRARSTDLSLLAAYMVDENTAFDGHKGQSLTFSSDDHQLRQPLYLPARVQGIAIPVEVDPLVGASAGMSTDRWNELVGRGVPEGGRYAAVSNEGSGDVAVIDLDRAEVVSRIRVGSRPRGIRISRDGRFVYVALSDDAPTVETDQDGIAVIDLRTGQVIHQYPAGSDPEMFDLSPDGRYLYASNEDAGTATVTDLSTGEVLATLPVGIEPEGVATSPDGRWVYVTAETSNTVSVIDTRRNAVAASFLVDIRPRSAIFSPTRPRAYVTNEISATVSVVETETHSVIDVIDLPDPTATPVGIAVSPDGRTLYVANGHAHSVSVIDADSKRLIADVPVGRRPWGIDVSTDGTLVFTANGLTNDISVLDARSLRVIETIRVGQRPWGVAVTP